MKSVYTVPLSVATQFQDEYCKNMSLITRNSNKIFIFACDQKIEHLHADFVGENIAPEVADPRHLFDIARAGTIGAMAVPFGLLTRYAHEYKNINYIAKLSGKTNLVPGEQKDPYSGKLWTVQDVVRVKKEHTVSICGVGCTVYIGSEYEAQMLQFASQMIQEAHQHGLVSVVWMYPRGKAVSDASGPLLLAGAAGLANALGADIVKIQAPKNITDLSMIVKAAGNTKVICAGGAKMETEQFLQVITQQMQVSGIGGVAVGRNIFQLQREQAIELTKEVCELI